VFKVCEQKLGSELDAQQTISLIASADLPPKPDSSTLALPNSKVGDPETL